MVRVTTTVLEAHVLGDGDWIAAAEVCQLCNIDLKAVREFAELGFVTPRERAPGEWQVPATVLPRLRVVSRLMRDLGVNASGAVLALELLERIHELERLTGDH
jgi:chaperone modulatory protein CbpM